MSRTGRRAQRVRWCTAERPAPKLAYYEAAEAYPRLAQEPWCRLTGCMTGRDMLPRTGPAPRIIKFLSATGLVDGHGMIRDVPALIAAYRAWVQYEENRDKPVSAQTAWNDIGQLTRRGLMRCVQSAAPGYPALYCLSYPVAVVEDLDGLPRDLVRQLPHRRPGPDTTPGPAWDTGGLDDDGEVQADPEETGADSPDPVLGQQLDTSPLTWEGFPPPPAGQGPHGSNRRSGQPGRGDHSTDNSDAAGLLARCRAPWARQRGWERTPRRDELAGIVPLTAAVIRATGRPGDVEQLLTERVASADDLLRTLRWRLGRELNAARRAEQARLTPQEEADAERRAAEYYAAKRAAQAAAVEARRGPGHAGRARAAVELAKRLSEERKPEAGQVRTVVAEDIAARERQAREARLGRWRAETPDTSPARHDEQALAEIRRLMAGSAEDRSRARALLQLAAHRARRVNHAYG